MSTRVYVAFLVVSHDSIGGCVRPSVLPSVCPLVRNAFVSAGRDKPANDLLRVYKLVFQRLSRDDLIFEEFFCVTKFLTLFSLLYLSAPKI